MKKHFLRKLGVYGFDAVEPVILAALISEDPLLLIGKAGTGKTFLLNSLSEALNLEHRHYNASFLSFDDLIGFPVPDANASAVRFLQTPATIWKAQSVLIDELSRCRPEIQNKFFSLIHERRIQGIALDQLRYRWAAMNPVARDSDTDADHYEGALALDQALADRFAFILTVPDWKELSEEEQELVINPAGEAAVNAVAADFIRYLTALRKDFIETVVNPSPQIVLYCKLVSTLLSDAGYRISPRRARLLARNITAIFIAGQALEGKPDADMRSKLFRLALTWSLPHRAWMNELPSHVTESAHAEAMRIVSANNHSQQWLTYFRLQNLTGKVASVLSEKADKDTRSLGVIQFLHRADAEQTAIFCFTLLPAFEKYDLLTEEAFGKVAAIGMQIINVQGDLKWKEQGNVQKPHPVLSKCQHALDSFSPNQSNRVARAKQLFQYLILCGLDIAEPLYTEELLNQCYNKVRDLVRQSDLKKK